MLVLVGILAVLIIAILVYVVWPEWFIPVKVEEKEQKAQDQKQSAPDITPVSQAPPVGSAPIVVVPIGAVSTTPQAINPVVPSSQVLPSQPVQGSQSAPVLLAPKLPYDIELYTGLNYTGEVLRMKAGDPSVTIAEISGDPVRPYDAKWTLNIKSLRVANPGAKIMLQRADAKDYSYSGKGYFVARNSIPDLHNFILNNPILNNKSDGNMLTGVYYWHALQNVTKNAIMISVVDDNSWRSSMAEQYAKCNTTRLAWAKTLGADRYPASFCDPALPDRVSNNFS